MRTNVRLLTFGALGGILLSVTRAPLGLDLLTVTAVEGRTAYTFRAAAIFMLAVAIANGRMFSAGLRPLLLLASLALGYSIHGLWLDALAPLGTHLDFVIAVVGILIAMFLVARVSPEVDESEEPDSVQAPTGPSLWEQTGVVLSGAAVAIALETTARPLRQLGLGLPADDTAFGIGFFVFLLLGAAAFGKFLPIARHGRMVVVLASGLAVLSCIVSLSRLADFSDPKLLSGFVKHFGSLLVFDEGQPTIFRVDISHLGTWRVDLLIAGSSLILPGLLLGVALFAARDSLTFAVLLVGAALGTFATPYFLTSAARPLPFDQLAESSHAAWLMTVAAYAAGIGAVFAAIGARSAAARSIGILGALALAATPSLISPKDPWLFSAWDQNPAIEPDLVIESAEGLLTVEMLRGSLAATLNRDRLTPLPTEEEADAHRIWRSIDLLGTRDGSERVLFVGQQTPSRVESFRRAGVTKVDRTAPWHRHMRALEEVLLSDSEMPPGGEVLSLADARQGLANGDYDLVIVPPNYGRRLPTLPAQWDSAPSTMPRNGDWSVPEGTTAVIWLDSASELASTDLGERVLVSTHNFAEPCVGIVLGEPEHGAELPPGAPRTWAPSALSTLRLRGYQRQHRSRARLFQNLQAAAIGTPHESFMTALALHYGEQSEISPFGSWDQGVVMTEGMLTSLREACLVEGELSPELRLFTEQIAQTLRTVRSPDLILEFIEPITRERGAWFELDHAVLKAYMEFDMEEEVTAQLPMLLTERVLDIDLLLLTAVWYRDHGDKQAALEFLTRAHAVQPGRWDVIRPAALLAHELGDDSAEAWLELALELDPDDHEIKEVLSAYRE